MDLDSVAAVLPNLDGDAHKSLLAELRGAAPVASAPAPVVAKVEVVEPPKPVVVEPVKVEVAKAVVETPAEPKPKVRTSPLLSLSKMLSGEVEQEQEVVATESVETSGEKPLDPLFVPKIEVVKPLILEFLGQWRPRFVAPFESMVLTQSSIKVAVPTSELHDELLRSKNELLLKVLEISGVKGAIDLEVEINEQLRAVRPIRLEDRIAHLVALNPVLTQFKARLDLDVE